MEILRRAVRGSLGSNSRLYRAGARFVDFISIVSKNGVGTWRELREIQEEKGGGNVPRPVTLKNLRYPIFVRPSAADVGTIINNVVREEYGKYGLHKEPRWMIDAGAYIGDTSAYFLSRFSKLKVIALEPHPESHKLAQLNLEPYGERVFLLRKGLYSSDGLQCLSGSETGAAVSASGIEIECTTVSSLLRDFGVSCLDILKIDIEGAEEAVFSVKPEAWLGRVGLLIIEFHGRRIELDILRTLKDNGFLMKRYRSVWYCWREPCP